VPFLTELVAHKRHHPGGELDLLGALIDADERLTEEDLVGTAYLLLLVGHDTTVNLIGNGMHALLHHPDQLRALRADPALIHTGLDELLRYDSPVRDSTFRVATVPMWTHGQLIEPGDIVSLLIGSANRDETRFAAADRLDLTRTPNEHLAFGRGAHFCIGTALSKMEGAIAFRLLLDRLGDVRLAVPADELRWRPSRVMRGLESLPVVRR
jgi:cytochrome P450